MSTTRETQLRDFLEKARPLSPVLVTPEGYVSRGNARYELGEYEAALYEYEAALAQRPMYVNALFNKGIVLARLREWNKAREAFLQTLDEARNQDVLVQADANYYLAVVLHELGHNEEALAAVTLATERGNEPAHAYFRARMHSVLGQDREALDWLRRAASARKKYAEAARGEPDFEPLRSRPDFSRLTA